MQTNAIRRGFLVLLGSSMLIAASGGMSVARAESPSAVVIKNFMFSPMELTVKAGSTVTWKNLDGEPHTVVNDSGMFRSAALDQNDTYRACTRCFAVFIRT
jgi:plastocyanin